MASKKPAKKTPSNRARELERLRELTRRAETEVASLLKRDRSGTINRMQLQTGLRAVKKRLQVLNLHYRKI